VSLRRPAAIASLAFLAFTTPLGIFAHLLSELAGLGWHDDADVIFSARHAYLAAIAIVTIGGLALALLRLPVRGRRARVAALVDALPFHGRGAGFALLSFAVQFGFFAITQFGEGCPLCGGDVVVGVFAAALAALLGALAVALGRRRILAFILALAGWFVPSHPTGSGRVVFRDRAARATSARRSPFAFRYRPPPLETARLTV
jgi:hypothetical protein